MFFILNKSIFLFRTDKKMLSFLEDGGTVEPSQLPSESKIPSQNGTVSKQGTKF